MKRKYYFTIVKLILIVILPVLLLALPADYLDHGQSLCLSQLLFHQECLGCGMARACMHLIHFDFENAFAYNMISFIVLPILCIVWVQWFIKEWKQLKSIRKNLFTA